MLDSPQMRVLLCTGDGGGNVPPTVAIASELVRRGNTVRLVAGSYYVDQIEAVGH